MTRSELARLLDHSVLKPESTAMTLPPAPTSCANGASVTTAGGVLPSWAAVLVAPPRRAPVSMLGARHPSYIV